MGKDYYQTLQLTRSAKDNDIKAAYVKSRLFHLFIQFCFSLITYSYRRLALKFHPVKNTNDHNAHNKFNDLAEAYDVLSDRMYICLYLINISLRFIKIKNEQFMINMVMKV